MRKSRFNEEQIIGFLKPAGAGMPVAEMFRKGGFSDATFYKRRAKFGGMEASAAQRLHEPEAENARLARLLAEAHLDIHALRTSPDLTATGQPSHRQGNCPRSMDSITVTVRPPPS